METQIFTCKTLVEVNLSQERGYDDCSNSVNRKNAIEIPAVQRGLVWNAQQVGTLWDSIMQKMPIGSLMAYRDTKEGPLQLIDGQQRFNAIRCGIKADSKDAFRIWVSIIRDKLKFMVCTDCHPWGFKEDYNVFSYNLRDEFNKILRHEETIARDEDYFEIATLEQSYPMVGELLNKELGYRPIFVPLQYALYKEGGYEAWCNQEVDNKVFCTPSEISIILNMNSDEEKRKDLESHIKDYFVKVQNKLHESGNELDKYTIPINIIEEDEKHDEKYLSTLFTRINTQGTRLSSDDERYSKLCVVMGKPMKDKIAELSKGFMPPSRLANWAVKLFLTIKIGKKDVISPIRDDDFSLVLSDNEYKTQFNYFCDSELGCIISVMRNLYRQDVFINENAKLHDAIPPIVYLEHRDDNWITVIASLYEMHKDLFIASNTNDAEYKKNNIDWYLLLGLLPEVMCSRSDCAHLFMREFWLAIKDCPDKFKIDLKTIICYGCAVAALHDNTFVHPYPSKLKYIKSPENGTEPITKIDIIQNWWNWNTMSSYTSRSLIPFTHNYSLLYFAQRRYLAHILKHVKPERREMWGIESNKPFDIDHIIPSEFWRDSWMMNQLPNKQILYFRHNRSKGAHHSGLPKSLIDAEVKSKTWFVYPTFDLYDHCNKESDLSIYEESTHKRWKYLIGEVYADLKIEEMITTINSFVLYDELPDELLAAKKRYCVMQSFQKQCKLPLSWGGVVYRGLTRNNEVGMSNLGDVCDFYHSLIPSLSLGRSDEDKGVPVFDCITIGLDGYVEIGRRRGFGVSPYVNSDQYAMWMSLDRIKNPHIPDLPDWTLIRDLPDWWLTYDRQCIDKFYNNIDNDKNIDNVLQLLFNEDAK